MVIVGGAGRFVPFPCGADEPPVEPSPRGGAPPVAPPSGPLPRAPAAAAAVTIFNALSGPAAPERTIDAAWRVAPRPALTAPLAAAAPVETADVTCCPTADTPRVGD